jgi:hypothetical protein
MRTNPSFHRAAKQWLDDNLHTALSVAREYPGCAEAYLRLLQHLFRWTTLLRPARDPRREWHSKYFYVTLFFLSRHHADWLRPIETWQPPPGNPNTVVAALPAHLFALYPMPACMTSAWSLEAPTEEAQWYKHVGRGDSLRTAGVPLPLTRAMAHQFTLAPHHYRVRQALRWAEVRGLGGSEPLARAVAATRLGREFGQEDFWLSVLRFFVANPGMDTVHVGPIVDFLHHQKFVGKEVFVPGQGVVHEEPPRPDYSMKGRTVASLLRQVAQWHRELNADDRVPAVSWRRSRIGEFQYVEGDGAAEALRYWTIRELLDSAALFREGLALRHCVAVYAGPCARRETSIWSMQLDTGKGPRRALTVEVDLERSLVGQARGRANRRPRASERVVLERWAAREGLRVAEYL